MENTDIPQFRTYRGEIELEGVVILDVLFVMSVMVKHIHSFFIGFM